MQCIRVSTAHLDTHNALTFDNDGGLVLAVPKARKVFSNLHPRAQFALEQVAFVKEEYDRCASE